MPQHLPPPRDPLDPDSASGRAVWVHLDPTRTDSPLRRALLSAGLYIPSGINRLIRLHRNRKP